MLIKRLKQDQIFRIKFAQVVAALGVSAFFAVIILFFSPLAGLFLAVGIIGMVVVARKPEIGILVIVFINTGLFYYETSSLISFASISLHISDLILIYLLLIIFIKLITKNHSLVRTPLDGIILWFYGAILLSAVFAFDSPSYTRNWVFQQLRPLTYYLVFFIVTNLIRERKQITTLIYGLLGIGAVASLEMLIQILFPSIHLVASQPLDLVTAGAQFSGVVRNYLTADRLIYPMFLIAFSWMLVRKNAGVRFREPLLVGILGIGLFLTYQRNYWLTMLSMIFLMGILVPLSYKLKMTRVFLAIVLLISLINIPGTRINGYLNAAINRLVWGMDPGTLAIDGSVQWRIKETEYALQSISQNSIFGIGLGNYYRPSVTDVDPTSSATGIRWYVHNAYLWVWVDMGLIGLIPFVGLLLWVVIRGLTRWQKIKDGFVKAFVLGSSLGILGQIITNVVAPNFLQDWSLVVFAIIFGLNELIYRLEES
jgi:O-antigen ligase